MPPAFYIRMRALSFTRIPCMRQYRLILILPVFILLLVSRVPLPAEPASRLQTVTKISLDQGLRSSVSLNGRDSSVESCLSFPWPPGSQGVGPEAQSPGVPAWFLGVSTPVFVLGSLDFRASGNLLGSPFSAEVGSTKPGGRPLSRAVAGEGSFNGIALGGERGVFMVHKESREPVFGFWESTGISDTGIIVAVQGRTASPAAGWYDVSEIGGKAGWLVLNGFRAGDDTRFFLAYGRYLEFPGSEGFFIRADAKLNVKSFYYSLKSCVSDGYFRALGGSTVPLYDIVSAIGFSGPRGQGMELKLRETESRSDVPAKKSLSLGSVAVFRILKLSVDSALDFRGADASPLFSVESSVTPFFIRGFTVGTYWESSGGTSRKLDLSLALALRGKLSFESGLLLRFLETSRALKASFAFGTRIGGFDIKLQGSIPEPWVFYPAVESPKFDISLAISTDSRF